MTGGECIVATLNYFQRIFPMTTNIDNDSNVRILIGIACVDWKPKWYRPRTWSRPKDFGDLYDVYRNLKTGRFEYEKID